MIRDHGEQLFRAELVLAVLRLAGLNLDDPEQRQHAIRLLRPFEAFATEIGFQNTDASHFWEALRQAEAGDATEFKQEVRDLIASVAEDDDSDQSGDTDTAPMIDAAPPADPVMSNAIQNAPLG
jgi:hypothetical protein